MTPPAYMSEMANHDHVQMAGVELANAARTVMQGRGEQWTSMRAAVFDSLAAFDRPASAYDIAEALSAKEGRRIAANSIYRILDLFSSANLVRRVESANAYLVNDHPACSHDCIFLICDACGATTHVDDDHLSEALRAAARQSGFEPVRPVLEVRGRCSSCSIERP